MGIRDWIGNIIGTSGETANEWVEERRQRRREAYKSKKEEETSGIFRCPNYPDCDFTGTREEVIEHFRSEHSVPYAVGRGDVKTALKGVKETYNRAYPGGFWNTEKKEGFKINLGKFFFVIFAIAASLVLPFIFKESGSAWFLSFAVMCWAVATLFPSHSTYVDENGKTQVDETKNGLLFLKASLNGIATIFLSLGLIAISPSTPFMRLLTLVVFTVAYLSFPSSGGDDKYKAYLTTWRMILGFYFMLFFIFAFMNVLSVSPLIFASLALMAFAFYFNLPETEAAANLGQKFSKFTIINKTGGENPGGTMAFGIMIMIFGATMALFLGNMDSTFLGFRVITLASLVYFVGIILLLMSSASGATGEAVLFSGIASLGLIIGAFDLWMEKHYFAAMGYNMLVGLSVSTGASSVQARPIIGVTALSFAVIILSSAYPAVLGEAVFGQWWPSVESGVTTLVGPMGGAVSQMQEGFQDAFLMFSCPSCYYEEQLKKSQANANIKSGGTAKSIDVSEFTFQVVNIPEQPMLATATLQNNGEFSASNINVKLKPLQMKNKKGGLTDRLEVSRKFVTCSGVSPSGDSCSWTGSSYNGDAKQITFTYGAGANNENDWGSALGSCSCYNSAGKLKGYCLPLKKDAAGKDLPSNDPKYDSTGCKKCASLDQKNTDYLAEGSSNSCDLSSGDTIGYGYGGWSAVVGFDYSFDYIVNVSLDTQLMQSNTLNDLLLKKQITLRDVKAEYSGGPVKASIWTQKQPVRAGEDTLAVISIENAGTGTVIKGSSPKTCAAAGGSCETWLPAIGSCDPGRKEIESLDCAENDIQKHCCVPETYSGKTASADFVLIIPFISGITPKIAEVSRGGMNCGDMNDKAIMDGTTQEKYNNLFIKGGKSVSVLGRINKGDSFELHCSLETNLEKGKLARYAFTFNYDIPKEIDRKSAIFVGNVNYNYQSSKSMETQITWAPTAQ